MEQKSNKRFTVRIVDKRDKEIVEAFFAQHPDLNVTAFIRSCIMQGIQITWDKELQRVVDRINANQRLHGGEEI